MMRALIIGGDSTIGSGLASRLREGGWQVEVTSRRVSPHAIALDLAADPAGWSPLPACDVAFLCAAVTKLDECKRDPQGTRLVNVVHMIELARRLQAQGTFLIFLSSNHVFDGRVPFHKADDAFAPPNEYGRQKAEFEEWLRTSGKPHAVLRLTKVISGRLPILDKWQAALQKGEAVEAFTDLGFPPLPLASVLEGLTFIANARKPGICQLSGSKDVTYFAIARELARRLGVDPSLVKESRALDNGVPAEFLPPYRSLDSSTLAHINVPPPFEVVFG